MSLWFDRYRPDKLDDLTIQPQANLILKNISKSFAFPHLLFSGPPGSGKKTRVMAFLRELYKSDLDITKIRSEYKNIEISDSKTIEVQVTSSQFHVEITPADSGNNDRHVISYFLKEIASSKTVNESTPIKIVVINEASRLSKLAQQALRRMMEKYARTCRIIMICDSLSQIIEPVRSRCLIIRTPCVPYDQVLSVLTHIAQTENCSHFDDSILAGIAEESQGNVRRAINFLQILAIQKSEKTVQDILPQWEMYLDDLADTIIKSDVNNETMKKIRNHLYELLIHCVPPTEIFRRLLTKLCSKVDPDIIPEITNSAALYEARMQNGTKPIFHLDAFIARFICIYRDSLSQISK